MRSKIDVPIRLASERKAMLPSWLDGRAASEFGEQIANDIRRLMPLEKDGKPQKNPAKRLQKLARIVERVTVESAHHRFNFYQKAKFANALRWSLKDSGYAPDFIQEIVALILARM
jgi:hypothetical protein